MISSSSLSQELLPILRRCFDVVLDVYDVGRCYRIVSASRIRQGGSHYFADVTVVLLPLGYGCIACSWLYCTYVISEK